MRPHWLEEIEYYGLELKVYALENASENMKEAFGDKKKSLENEKDASKNV